MTANIISIGYEGLTLDAMISRLRIKDVRALVDVRLNAISRKRGFSKRALSEALEAEGISYLHMPELGNHRDNRAGYATPGAVEGDAARGAFREAITGADAQAAVEKIRDLAIGGPIAVFCYELEEKHCHREQVIDAVLGRELVAA